MNQPRLALLAIVVTASAGSAQRTWTVNVAGGPGVDFTDIPPAVAAAQPGDTIRVLGASTALYSAFTLGKAIAVDAPGGAYCTGITVTGIASGSVARVSGFRPATVPFPQEFSVTVSSCPGTVVLSDMQIGAKTFFGPNAMLTLTDAASVLVTGTTIAPKGLALGDGLFAAIAATRSGLILQRCVVTGVRGVGDGHLAWAGGPAIRCASSTVVVVDSAVAGGTGGDGVAPNTCGANGGNAIEGSSCVVLGKSSLTGGAPGRNPTGCPVPSQGTAADGSITIAADASVVGALRNGARGVRSLGWIESPGSAGLGAPVTVKLHAVPSTVFLLYLDDGFGVTPIPLLETPYLGTLRALYLGPFVADASGVVPLTFTVPMVPAWAGRSYYLHAVAIAPGTNELSLTNLGDLLLR